MRPIDATLTPIVRDLLADEFGAQHAYTVHAQQAIRRNYPKLAAVLQEHYEDEQKHSRLLIDYLFVQTVPVEATQGLCVVHFATIPAITADFDGEQTAENKYSRAILAALRVNDQTLVQLLQRILKDERDHIEDFVAMQDQLAAMGEQNFLASLV